jgi:hypothetical protein
MSLRIGIAAQENSNMGYRDDFYVADNLIGYTGQIHRMPSVYFQRGSEFGHITQIHDSPLNNGREPVDDNPDYTMGNEWVDGEWCLVERIGGEEIHTSRNRFIPVAGLAVDEKAVLLQSIWKWPEVKMYSGLDEKERDQHWDQVDRKDALHKKFLRQGAYLRPVPGHQINDRSAPAIQDREQFSIKVVGSGPSDPLVFDYDIRSARKPDKIISGKTDAQGQATAQWMFEGEIRFRGFGAFGRVETQWQKIVLSRYMTLQFGRYRFICELL